LAHNLNVVTEKILPPSKGESKSSSEKGIIEFWLFE